MKKNFKEIIICLIQIFIFYLLPKITIAEYGPIGMVLLLLTTTFVLSIVSGCILKNQIKYYYPFFISLIFIPTIWIYYNESALIHSLWYFIITSIGLLIGTILNKILIRK